MIEEILHMVSKKSSKKIITTERIYNKIKVFTKEKFDIEIFNDLRSAAFFSLGNSNLDEKGTILILEGEYLPNIYTAMTEAWFQRKQIIVIALYEKYNNIKCEYIRRCIPNIINIYDDDINVYQNEINSALTQNYPCLINMVTEMNDINEKKINYDEILNKLSNCLKKDNEVFVYNSIEKKYNYEFKINNIEEKHKYGILSKYIGYVISKEQKIVLCAPSDILKLDLNIFNNRYTNSNIKICLFGDEAKKNSISNWVKENKINVRFEKVLTEEEIKEFYNSDNPEIIFMGGI